MNRIDCTDITATLVMAMEKADRMENVIIIYQTKKEFGDSPDGYSHGILCNDGTTVALSNYLLDIAKRWVLQEGSYS